MGIGLRIGQLFSAQYLNGLTFLSGAIPPWPSSFNVRNNMLKKLMLTTALVLAVQTAQAETVMEVCVQLLSRKDIPVNRINSICECFSEAVLDELSPSDLTGGNNLEKRDRVISDAKFKCSGMRSWK
jgi:hypothetical protein